MRKPLSVAAALLAFLLATPAYAIYDKAERPITEPQSPVNDPYAQDRLAPYFDITSKWAVTKWTVYSCDSGQGKDKLADPTKAAKAYNESVTPIFAKASSGHYKPKFVSGGVLKGADVGACSAKAKGDAVVIIYHDPARKAGAIAHGTPPATEVVDGMLKIRGIPRVVVGSSNGTYSGGKFIAHEIGHALGWPHIPISGPSHPSLGVSAYGNMTNLMSGGVSVAAWNRYIVGWTPADVFESTFIYELHSPGTGEDVLIVIPSGKPAHFWTVAAGPDGVEIHEVKQFVGNAVGACASQSRQGLPVCFGVGTKIEAIAPPPQKEAGDSQELPPWTPRPIGWKKGQSKKIGGVTVKVLDLEGKPGSYTSAKVQLVGKAPKLWDPADMRVKTKDGGNSDSSKSGGSGNKDKGKGGAKVSFSDVASDSPFRVDIGFLVERGITKGCNPPRNDRFCPDAPVTRGQMAAFLVRALNLKPANVQFADTKGHIFAADIAALAASGITKGCNPPRNDRFCPEDKVTRGQMAAFLVRALGLTPAKGTFADTKGHLFAADIAALAASGITKGCNPPRNDRFCPDKLVTRGEMAAFLHRALDN